MYNLNVILIFFSIITFTFSSIFSLFGFTCFNWIINFAILVIIFLQSWMSTGPLKIINKHLCWKTKNLICHYPYINLWFFGKITSIKNNEHHSSNLTADNQHNEKYFIVVIIMNDDIFLLIFAFVRVWFHKCWTYKLEIMRAEIEN